MTITDETTVVPAFTASYSVHDDKGDWFGTAQIRAYQPWDAVVYGYRPITATSGDFDVVLSRPREGLYYSLVTVCGLETALRQAREICKIWARADATLHLRFAIDGERGMDPLLADDLRSPRARLLSAGMDCE